MLQSDETKKSEGSSGWIPFVPRNLHPKDKPLLDISTQAVWTISSCKSGYGVDELLSDNVEKYWQSDGPQPHTILLEFQKKTDIAFVMLYMDFKNDESYTPSKIQVKMGSSHQDVFFRVTQTFIEPQGWAYIDLRDKDQKPQRVFWVQIQVIQNHQNGRDTHIRSYP
uniref:Anaphase-promoting complex subunit 10 n=1 Tax=Caenorhabditis japonica TaxID=281687 RepID=A0A8R1DHZ6_CAEJA